MLWGDRKEYCFDSEDRKRLCYWTRSLFKFSARLSTLSALLLDFASLLDQLICSYSTIVLLTSYPDRTFRMIDRGYSITLFTALLLGAALLASTSITFIPKAAGVNSTITLTGFISAWNGTTSKPNPTITVTQGDSITLRLSSGDGAPHQWFVDVDKNGPSPDCSGADICSSLFSTSTVLTFTVSFAPGTYTYYCSVHPATMLGSFVVNPSSSVGGTALPADRLALVAPYVGLLSVLAGLVATFATIMRHRRNEKR